MYDILSVKFSCFHMMNWHKRKIVKIKMLKEHQRNASLHELHFSIWKKKTLSHPFYLYAMKRKWEKNLIICSVITRIILFWQVFFLFVKKIASTCNVYILSLLMVLFVFCFVLDSFYFWFFYFKFVDLLFQLCFRIYIYVLILLFIAVGFSFPINFLLI